MFSQSIMSWYRYRADRLTNREDPWKTPLKALRMPMGRTPKLLPPWQVWMKDCAAVVNEECTKLNGQDNPVSISERNRIARLLFEGRPEDEREEYLAKAKQRLETEKAAFEQAQIGEPSTDPRDQQE